MSLPLQTIALLQAARDMAKGLPADAVLLLVETPLDWVEVQQKLVGCRLFVAADRPALTKSLHESEDWNVIELDPEPLPIQERMSNALLKAVTDEQLKPGAHVVVLYNGIATMADAPEPFDSLSVLHLGEHLERMTAADLRKLGSGIPQDVLKAVVDLSTEIGREGREGHPVGTVIVVGDTRKVQSHSRFLNFNPFRGYTKAERDIRDRKVREQIKEVAKLDGAILINRDGIAEAACVYLDVPADGGDAEQRLRQPARGRRGDQQEDQSDCVLREPIVGHDAGVSTWRRAAADRAAGPAARLAAAETGNAGRRVSEKKAFNHEGTKNTKENFMKPGIVFRL